MGRWLRRDPIGERGSVCEYSYISNAGFDNDRLGLSDELSNEEDTKPSATAKTGPYGGLGSFVLDVMPKNIQEGCELNFIQFVREFVTGKESGWTQWSVDSKYLPGQPPPLPPYYYNYSDSNQSVYIQPDGSIRFHDQPDIATPMEFYLIIVQRCCLEYYGESKKCECCKKSRATILGSVHWKTANKIDGGYEYVKPTIISKTNYDKAILKNLLKRFVEGKEFSVHGCEQYMKDNNLQYDGMPVTVELDYGGKL